jgi:nucleoside-diphosphate-sugar epimerase
MRIFVAGATGVLGRRTVERLVVAGHEVAGIARSSAKAAELRAAGALPVAVSLFDAAALGVAIAGHDAVVNLATHIPTTSTAMRSHAWDENTRIRVEGSRNLVDAAIAAGAQVYVQESIAFAYGEHATDWIDASTTDLAPSPYTEPVRAAEANAERFSAGGGRGVVLRFGMFQAAESHHATSIFTAARRGILLDPCPPAAYFPSIDGDDAAAAVVVALDAPAGIYDVVDDEPVTRAEATAALATAVGRRRLRRPPYGKSIAAKAGPLIQSQRVSNARFKAVTGWRPAVRNQRDAIAKVARLRAADLAPNLGARVCLWLLALTGLALGVYAEFFPRAFYDNFPFNRGWVMHDGPYNEHLVRDFGAMNLALAAVTLAALWFGVKAAARAAAIGWLVFAVPHTLYHFRHLSHYETADKWGNVITLSGSVLLAVVALVLLARPSYSGGREPVPQPPDAGVRHDDLRRDVGAGGGDRLDQPRAGIS